MYLCAADRTYLDVLLQDDVSPLAFYLKYGVLADELYDFIGTVRARGPAAAQLVQGLLRAQTIFGVDPGDVRVGFVPMLRTRAEYPGLAVKCNSKLIHDTDVDAGDVSQMTSAGITLFKYGVADFKDVLGYETNNILLCENLTQGGNVKFSDHILKYVRHCSDIKVYDNHYNVRAHESMIELLNLHNSTYGPFMANISIYCQSANVADKALFQNQLSHLTTGLVRVETGTKLPAYSHKIHDRYVQIDDAYTVTLTAGLDCYRMSGGFNRASCVIVKHVLNVYNTFEIFDASGAIVSFRY